MPGYGRTERSLLTILIDGKPRSRRELIEETGLTSKSVGSALYRLWKAGSILRTQKPIYEGLKSFKGRAGIKKNTRAYHLYLYGPGKESINLRGMEFVKYQKRHLEKEMEQSHKFPKSLKIALPYFYLQRLEN